ncbi:beta-glucuronidase-like isoform X2 [Artemia franciscana]
MLIIKNGKVRYSVLRQGCSRDVLIYTDLLDENGSTVASSFGIKKEMCFKRPKLWWPKMMNERPGYLYTLKIHLKDGEVEDFYRLKVGIRSISWNISGIFVNHGLERMKIFGDYVTEIDALLTNWPFLGPCIAE